MKKLLLLNWPAKLFCLVLAVIIWSFINHWVTTNDAARPARNWRRSEGPIPEVYCHEEFYRYRN